MDSALARFAVLIVLFFLLTGDLSGVVRHLFEEARSYGGGGGVGGKHQQHRRQQHQNQQSADAAATPDSTADDGPSVAAAAVATATATADADGTVDDNDVETLAKSYSAKMKLVSVIKESCLPKLICELTASTNRDTLTASERYLLSLIRETTISNTAEVTSKYHFAAHMGQLISGIDNTGCHNFYPGCPFPGLQVMQMMKKVKIL